MIPAQLKNLRFCRVKKGTKKPFEKDWTNKPYFYHEMEDFKDENYGVLCGYHDLAVIDCDEEVLVLAVRELLPKTYSVRTGGGGIHFYFFIPDLERKIILEVDEKHLGEIQSYGTQVVGAGSLHPNGKLYEVVNNVGIETISFEELKKVLSKFMKMGEKIKSNEEIILDPSASKLREKIKITAIAHRFGFKTERGKILCPFHEDKDPSMGLSNELGVYHCFGCGAKGDLVTFYKKLRELKNEKK